MSMTNLVCDFSCNWLVFPFAVGSEADWFELCLLCHNDCIIWCERFYPPCSRVTRHAVGFYRGERKSGERKSVEKGGASRLRKKSEHVLTKATPTAGNSSVAHGILST